MNSTLDNTKSLLKNYRMLLWRKTILEQIYGSNCTESIEWRQKIEVIGNAAKMLRKFDNQGKKLYWVIYYTYLSEIEPESISDVLTLIANELCETLPRRTYYWLRQQAINKLSCLME